MPTERTSRVVSVSLPPELAEEFDRLAEVEGRTRSELARRMIEVYRTYLDVQTFESLQRYGAAQAARAGIESEGDVERLLRDARA